MLLAQAVRIFRDFLVSELKGKVQNNNWVNIRGDKICSECTSHRNRSALYINVSENSPLYLNCFRSSCSMKRACSAKDLEDLGFRNKEAIKVLMNNSNKIKLTYKDMSTSDELIITNTSLSIEQENYFHKRCNFVPTADDIKLFRIIPDIRSVMNDNFRYVGEGCGGRDIDTEKLMEKFDKLFRKNDTTQYITYFTNDSKKFLFRSIEKDSFVSKGQLSRTTDRSIYSIMRGHQVESIVLTEGFFDLINIYKYFCIQNNMLYSCTGGFAAFEHHIVELYKKNIDTVKSLILFCDSDIKDKYTGRPTLDTNAVNELFKRVFKKIPSIAFEEIFIVYNTGSKDFGDFSERIRPEKYRVDVSNIDGKWGRIELIKEL